MQKDKILVKAPLRLILMGFRLDRKIKIIRKLGRLYELKQGDVDIVISEEVFKEIEIK